MSGPPVPLQVHDLESGYGEAPVIRKVSLSVRSGEIVTVLGKNGMGKSTLLKTCMGFVKRQAGSVRIGGRDISGLPPYLIARRSVAYTPQEYTLFQDLTVEENLRLGVQEDRLLDEGMPVVAKHFPVLPTRLKQKAGTLSGGEQKMLLVSRAIISRPKVMLIDEISEGLQPTMIERVAEVLKAERERTGVSILLVEQNLAFALSIADRYAILKLGEIVDEGSATKAGIRDEIAEHLQV